MTVFLNFFIGMLEGVISVLKYPEFEMYGYSVRFIDVIIAFFIIGLVISIFWRGAKT